MITMFVGEYKHTIDKKNRIIIPAKFREELQDTFFITKGFDGCLSVYTNEQWEKVLAGFSKLPNTKKEVRRYIRLLTSSAISVECDTQGRVCLSEKLRELAKLEKECLIIGVNDHVEIWSKDQYDEYFNDDQVLEDIAEEITEFIL